jgi:hypothetical protein
VISGNTRLKAARLLGHERVPVVWFEGTDLEATAYAIADNKTHEFSTWDEPLLAKLLEELRAEDSIEGTGFSDQDIDSLIAELEAQQGPVELDDQGPDEPPANPVSRTGDLWLLGGHRLLCGDSTKAVDLERLMGGKRATLLATDPPYCVDYDGNSRPIHDGKPSENDWSHVYREVEIEDLGQFLDGALSACLPHVTDEAGIYMWHAHVQQPVIAATFERHGLLLHQILVWVKPTATFGHCYYRWRHEPCAFGWKRGNKQRHGGGTLETVWEVDWEGKSRVVGNEHPTQNSGACGIRRTFRNPSARANSRSSCSAAAMRLPISSSVRARRRKVAHSRLCGSRFRPWTGFEFVSPASWAQRIMALKV